MWRGMEAAAPKSMRMITGALRGSIADAVRSPGACVGSKYYSTDVDQDVDQRSFKASGPLKAKVAGISGKREARWRYPCANLCSPRYRDIICTKSVN